MSQPPNDQNSQTDGQLHPPPPAGPFDSRELKTAQGSELDSSSGDYPSKAKARHPLPQDQSTPASAVQAEITRNALDSLRGYPIATSLLRPDLLSSLSNLTIGSSSSTVDDLLLDSLRPFNQSLGLIDQTLHSSTGQHHSVNRDWVDRQILAANRLISCFDNPSDQANQLSFNDLLRPSLTPPDQSVTAEQRLGSQNNHRHPRGLAQAHLASLGALPPDRFITNRHPQHSAPSQPGLGSDDDDGSIRSFYDSFVLSTLRNQRSYLIPTSPDIHPKPRPSPGSVPSSSASSSSPSPIPQSPSTAPLPSSSSLGRQPVHSERVQQPVTRDQAQPIPIGPRRDSSSPDPLEMNLRVRSHSKNARLHPRASLGQVNYQTPPLKKTRVNPKTDSPIKLTRPHSLGNRPTIAPILLPASFPQNCSAPDHAQEINTPSGAKFSEKSNSSRAPGIKKDCTADLVTLVEDIMEADDLGLESPSNLFCRIDSEAVLTPTTLSNLISLIERSDGQTISQLPLGDLSRLIKILGRGVRIAEELIVIPPQLKQKAKLSCLGNSGVSPSALKNAGSRKHGKAPKSRSKRNPKLGETNGSTGCEKLDQSDENGLGIASMDDFCQQADVIQQRLGDLSICLKSINATLSLLVRDKFLPKQFYSEELVRSIMSSIKNQLSSAIYPFIEAGQKESNDAYLRDLGRLILTSGAILDQISSSFSFISTSILPKVDLVVDRMELSESILIHVGYIAVGPFSVNAGPLLNFSSAVKKKNLGDGSMKNMRLGCLKLLKTLSSKYPDHRNWMVDEILSLAVNFSEQSVRSNMTVYHLSNGKSIQTVSALLLHIVQSCLTGCKARVAAVINSGKEAVLDEDTSNKTPGISSESNKSLTDRVKECVEPGISSAAKIGIKIISFLMQKSGKTSRSTHETCYRVVFERLVEDLINLLFLPDWPVAEFMLGICCKTMVGLLEGTKSSAESNAVKGLCLDHLGSITARLIEPLGDDTENLECTHAPMISFKSLLKNFDRVGLSRLFHLQKNVLVYLATISHADSSFNSSTDFAFGQWIFEIVNALKNLESEIKETDREHDYKGSPEESRASSRLLFSELQSKIEQFAAIHFEPCTTRQTRHLSDEFPASLRHGSVNEAVSGAQGLKGMTKVFLERILSSSASPSTTFRSKAIRALGLVVAKDPNVFFKDSVRSAIENRMLDSSPAVRDATIELLGKYVVSRPDLAVAFLPQISARIADKGVSVRRRVVKLLKAIYMILNDEDWIMLKVEISHKLISRINDEENSIKELAMNSIEDLWFSHSSSSPFDPGLAGSLIMKIATSFCDLPSPLESVMKFMFNQNGKKGQSFLETFVVRCREIVDHLIDQLMDVAATSRDSDFNEVECVKTICILSSSCRKLLNPVKASILLPYLKGATTPSEQALVQYLLKIFRACALEAPKSSGTFGQQLQNSLLVLVNKPNFNVGGTILQELISCFCAVIKFQTHDYGKLLNVFKACNKQLSDLVEQLEANTEKPNLKPLPLLMHLVSTLAAYGDFEQIPSNYKDVREGFRAISEQPMHLYVYKILVQIYHNEHVTKLRGVAIICLGFLYRSFPKLMTRTDSLEIMDGIFKVNAITEVELQHRLIKVIAEFIEGQAEQLGLKNELDDATGVDMGQLIGNCEGFEDSGVSSAIVQRYLRQITSLAQSVQPQIQKIALDIISYTVKQGLAHPLECVPVLVSLESSLDESFSKKAFGLHRLLHVQRANLVHSRFLLTMEQVYEYHSNPGAGKPPASGYVADPPRSVMGPWYQLLSEKRVWKIEFLKAIVKKFYIDPQNANVDLRSVLFARYLAEGLLTLDFKTEEELLIIITSLNESIGQYAYQTLQLLEGDQKKSLLELLEDEEGGDTKNKYNFNLIGYRVCVALGIAFVLRDLLKDAFGISDKKALKFMVEFEKTKNKKVRETPAHRKISLKELCLKFDQYLKLKIPGLSGDEETFQLQARAFANMVREDFDVKDSGEHGMLDEESGQEEQDDSEDGADGDDGNMQID